MNSKAFMGLWTGFLLLTGTLTSGQTKEYVLYAGGPELVVEGSELSAEGPCYASSGSGVAQYEFSAGEGNFTVSTPQRGARALISPSAGSQNIYYVRKNYLRTYDYTSKSCTGMLQYLGTTILRTLKITVVNYDWTGTPPRYVGNCVSAINLNAWLPVGSNTFRILQGEGEIVNGRYSPGEYTGEVMVEASHRFDNGMFSISLRLEAFGKVKLSVEPSTLVQPGALTIFTHNVKNALQTEWDYGDDWFGQGLRGLHYYYTPGSKDIRLRITFPDSCTQEVFFPGALEVRAGPLITAASDPQLHPAGGLYPNPVQGLAYVWVPNQTSYQWKVYSLSGTLVAQSRAYEPPADSRLAIDLAGLPSGAYRLELQNQQGQLLHQSFIKQ